MRTPNTSRFPIVELPLADADEIDALGDFLFERGIYVTLAALPPGPAGPGRLPRADHRCEHARPDRHPWPATCWARSPSVSAQERRRGRRPGRPGARTTARAITHRAWLVYLAATAVVGGRVRRRPAELRPGVQRGRRVRRRGRRGGRAAQARPGARLPWYLFAFGRRLRGRRRAGLQLHAPLRRRAALPVRGRRGLPGRVPGAHRGCSCSSAAAARGATARASSTP